jgi:hypothetical protein
MKMKTVLIILLIVALLLLIPLIAMQFTDEVNWSISDFMVAGALLLGTGLSGVFLMGKIKNSRLLMLICLTLLAILLLIWAELAVGIF